MSPYTLKPDRYSSHAQIAAWLIDFKTRVCRNRECAVLDVGCAQGFLGNWLSATEFYLMGVDSNPEYLAALHSSYRQKILANVESEAGFILDRPPDVMVLADVLEHCRQPAEVLRNLCCHQLAAGAKVIISVPNVAHFYVRLSLLMGRFNYAERGILDRTHLRFFTLRTASELCAQNAIRVEEIRVTPTPLPLLNPRFGEGQPLYWIHALNGRITYAFKKLVGYQFIFIGTYQP